MAGPRERAGTPIAARAQHRLHLVGRDGAVADRRPIGVLFVEDDDEDVFLLRRHLGALPSFAVDFTHAPSVDEARSLLIRQRFDVILCDFWLGSETTVPLIDELRLAGKASPVVLVSSLENDDIELIGRRAGAAGFVPKADLSAAALDRIFNTLLPQETMDIPAGPEPSAATWLKVLMRSLDQARATVGRAGREGESLPSGGMLGQTAASEAIRRDIVATLFRLEQATRGGAPALARFDAVPLLVDAVDRIAAAGAPVDFVAPAMPIIVEASPTLFGDLVQGFLSEAADVASDGSAVAVAPSVRGGNLVLEIAGPTAPSTRRDPPPDGDEAARAAAAAETRRFLVETLARAAGGAVDFAAPGTTPCPGTPARLEVPLRVL
jgi:CheY-like chemotaxis protein